MMGMMLMGTAQGQIVRMGHDTRDGFLAGLWGQNQNTSNLVQGVSANNGTNRFGETVIPLVLKGTSATLRRTFDGLFLGTNLFSLQTWDTNNGALQSFDFTLNGDGPVTTNTVSRVSFPETNSFKVLNNWRIQTNGSFQTGVPVAKGTSYGRVVTPVASVNRIYVQVDYVAGSTAHYLEWDDGVLSGAQ